MYDPPTDIDSTPDSNQGNDTYGGDNQVNNNNNDQDDHDPAEINPEIIMDLALMKTLVDDSPIASFGEIRTFEIESI